MTVGRTSAFNAAQTCTIATILLAGLLTGVKADCWVDAAGIEQCDRSGIATHAGIGVGLFLLLITLIFSLLTYRRRRAAQFHLAYVQQNQPNGESAYNGYGGQPPYAPQYPPQAHHGSPGGKPPYAYGPNPGFSPDPPPSLVLLDLRHTSYHVTSSPRDPPSRAMNCTPSWSHTCTGYCTLSYESVVGSAVLNLTQPYRRVQGCVSERRVNK